jgi:tetratricopeptide (TPR) repeat protein
MPRQKSDHVDSAAALAGRLRVAREAVGLSQRQLARDICTPAYVSRLEKGERIPSLQLLRRLADRLGCDADELASGVPAGGVDPMLDAELALRLGEPEQAEHLFREAAEDPQLRGRALAGLGQLAYQRGDHRSAVDFLEEARESGTADSPLLDTLGRAYALSGQLDSAIGIFEHALEHARAQHNVQDTTRFEVLLANALVDSGNYGRAAELLGDALAETADAADPIVRARLWWTQSRLHEAQGNGRAAADYARRALEVLEQTEHTTYAARAYQLLAHIEIDRGHAANALELLERGYPLVEQSGNRYERAMFKLERARALAQIGDREEAASAAMEASALMNESSPGDAARAYLLLGEIFEQLDDRERARELYELAIDQLPAENHHLGEAYTRLAGLLEAEGRKDEALELLKRAMRSQTRAARR